MWKPVITSINNVTQWSLHDRDPLTKWSTNHITLAGDAAHPMLPFAAQGANQAIEDAFTIAACLKNKKKEVIPAALKHYEQLRRPRTAEVQTRSRTNEQEYHQTNEQRKTNTPPGSLKAQAALYAHDAEAKAKEKTK